MPERVRATPTKEFFVFMITKDISLEDCILDFVDNCVDGAKRTLAQNGQADENKPYEGYWAKITFDKSQFSIQDNCGGIPIDWARNYAFRFGRDPKDPTASKGSIGLYGIGMKRSLFKIGRDFDIQSSTDKDAFSMHVDVDEWLYGKDENEAEEDDKENGDGEENRKLDSWDFSLEEQQPGQEVGTTININALAEGIGEEFGDATFENNLRDIIARDYYHIIKKGFSIEINQFPIKPYPFEFKYGEEIRPLRQLVDVGDDVKLEIVAGFVRFPGDEPGEADEDEKKESYRKYYGWYVMCNERVVLAADKTKRTVWAVHRFPSWHQQYDGFVGLAMFQSDKPDLLPWTTTKRAIDEESLLYRKALTHMREATRPFKDYTNERKRDKDRARKIEQETPTIPIADIKPQTTHKLPSFGKTSPVKTTIIRFRKPRAQVEQVKHWMGDDPSNTEVGEYTFDYFFRREIGE